MGSTRSKHPSTRSALFSSMNATISCLGGRAPPRRKTAPSSKSHSPHVTHELPAPAHVPVGLRRCHASNMAVVDINLFDPAPDGLDPYPSCVATRCTVPCSVPSSARNVLTIRTAAAFSSSEYRRPVDPPDPRVAPMTPFSFPKSGAFIKPRAVQEPHRRPRRCHLSCRMNS